MNDNHEIGHGDHPCWLCHVRKNVVRDMVAVSPVADDRNREVAHSNNDVGEHDTTPHWDLGWPFFCRRDRCLNLQHDIVPCVCKGHSPERVECTEHKAGGRMVRWEVVVGVFTGTERRVAVAVGCGNCPRDRRVTARYKTQTNEQTIKKWKLNS